MNKWFFIFLGFICSSIGFGSAMVYVRVWERQATPIFVNEIPEGYYCTMLCKPRDTNKTQDSPATAGGNLGERTDG